MIPAFALHGFYNIVVLLVARPASRLNPRHIASFTAVMDPLLLSLGLALMGQVGQLFTCFYLFTILGFGFRIGARTMAICQAASITGFACVALLAPPWREHPVPALSVLMFLAVVPLYARSLISRLQLGCEHAESESRAKTQLLANVSHELRTPLTRIVSSAQLMREENADRQVRKRSDAILTLSRELMAQINALLDSAKYGADALRLERAPFRMADIAEQLRRTLGATALSKGILLQVGIDERMPEHLLGDARHLARVMLNLGGNAVKFTEHGEIAISMAMIDENALSCQVRFCCRDTGIGIAPELHRKIFEPFFQASAGATRRYGGTGLGMSIAHDILERMGSVMRVQSAPGQGSRFQFDLWLDKIDPQPLAGAENTDIVRSKRILLADDNATNLLLTTQLLERDGHQVLAASNGREAVHLLNTCAVGLAILDFNMGDMDGASVLQLYRFGTLAPAPVYVLTADSTAATARRLMDGGAAGVLHKPVDLPTLRQAISLLFSAGAPLFVKGCSPGICIEASRIAVCARWAATLAFLNGY
ncbi:MAG: ATP-binding protein [Noviherbaspirillum sp.]